MSRVAWAVVGPATEPDTLASIARVPEDPQRSATPQIGPLIMTSPTQLSVVANRTSVPAISTLMHMALATPGLISLAAGFVDQQSLPVELAAEEIATILADAREGRRAGCSMGRPWAITSFGNV